MTGKMIKSKDEMSARALDSGVVVKKLHWEHFIGWLSRNRLKEIQTIVEMWVFQHPNKSETNYLTLKTDI